MSRERSKKAGAAANSAAAAAANSAAAAAGLHEKLQILRSITHSRAMSNSSIIMDASEYIKELKHKVGRLNQEMPCTEVDVHHGNRNSFPTVTVETLGHGFLVHVSSGKSCPGLLVPILEAFDELGLDVLQATASCAAADTFRLEPVGGGEENVDEQVVKRAVLQAIRNCSDSGSEQEEDL